MMMGEKFSPAYVQLVITEISLIMNLNKNILILNIEYNEVKTKFIFIDSNNG